jgi:hypothetical protein
MSYYDNQEENIRCNFKIIDDEIMRNLESVTRTIEFRNNYDQKKEK